MHTEEVKTLLALSQTLATVRDKENLLRTLIEQLQPAFGFHDCGLFVFNQDKTTLEDWTVSIPTLSPSAANTLLAEQDAATTNFHDSVWELIVTQLRQVQQPLVYDYSEPIPGWQYYEQSPVIEQFGYQEAMVSLLQMRGEELGVFCINSLQKGQFNESHTRLFGQVVHQIAVAVANILANEEILEREREKTQLLEISEAISRIQNKKQMLRVIYESIRPLFPFDSAGLFITDSEKDLVYEVLDSEAFPDLLQKTLTEQNLLGPWGLSDSNPNSWWVQNHVVIRSMLEEAQFAAGKSGETQFEAGLSYGLKQMIGGPLYANGKKIGAICFNTRQDNFYSSRHASRFKSISDQVAVALANILANEEILEREREKALQLSVIDALINEHDWGRKLLAVVQAIQAHVPFDYASVGLQANGQTRYGYRFYRTGHDEYQTMVPDDFLRLSGLSPEQYTKLRQQRQDTTPLLLNEVDFRQHCRQHELKRIIGQTFRFQSHLLIPVPLTREGRFMLAFYSRQPNPYQPYHLDLLLKLRPTIALTLDRLLAYEEVETLSKQLKQENIYLQEEVRTNYRFEEIVGTSQALREVFEKVSRVGPMSSTVLILGETGTGKELVARAIHQASPRRAKPLIKINCAALPAQLIESELFGHEKGAFTGAIERRVGKFELAQESTIFLDEIGELPLELQAKLLRAIQEKEIERLGSNKVIQTDVRVLAATNRNLEKEVAEGRFRSDLYFRLNVYPIKLPPLRERREDIPLLATHFIQKLSKKLGKPISGLSNGAINEMQSYHWPGNIRELEHVIERAAIESVGGIIKNLSLLVRSEAPPVMLSPGFQLKSYADGERELIMNTLRHCNGRIRGEGGAAQLLKIKATTLEARMKKLGIKREFLITEQAGA